MSSLAKQLKQLQIPGLLGATAAAKTGRKVSLLFDAREASDIDNETIFSIGINGLEELKSIDVSFAQFESTLFNESSKTLERTLQTKGVNDKLDKEIVKFLRYLSPYVLLKPAHKTIEWLIRRYRIHVFNVSELLSSVFPYHETKFFARIVQLLPISDPSSQWNWLHPVQKSGSPLPRSTLLQRCISDPSFFFLVCDLVNQLIDSDSSASSSRTLLTFYASTVVGCIETMDRVSEEFLMRLVPYIFRGLKTGIPDLTAGSYMIVGQLCVKCALEEHLVKSMIESICKHLTSGLASEGLMCLTYICQTQMVTRLPKKALQSLVKFPHFSQHLCHLAAAYSVSAFLDVLLPQLISSAVKDGVSSEDSNAEALVEIICSIVKDIELENAMVVSLARKLLEEYSNACSTQLNEERGQIESLNQNVSGLAQLLEKRYPIQLEKGLEDYLQSSNVMNKECTEEDSSHWAMEFVSLALSGVKSQILPDSSTTLVLSLNHPKPDIRQMAVKHLAGLINGGKSSAGDTQFVSDSLVARLGDDDPSVVQTVLELGQVLVEGVPVPVLVEKLFLLLHKKSEEWEDVQETAVSVLVGEWLSTADSALLDDVVCGLLQFLFLQPKKQKLGLSLVKLVSKSPLALRHPLLLGMKSFMKKKEWKGLEEDVPNERLTALNSILLTWLGDQLAQMQDVQRLGMLRSMAVFAKRQTNNSLSLVVINCIMGRLVAMITDDGSLQLYEIVLEVMLPQLLMIPQLEGSCETPHEDDTTEALKGVVPIPLLSKIVSLLGKHSSRRLQHVSATITLWLCRNMIKSLPVTKEASSGYWWRISDTDSLNNRYTKVLLQIFQAVATGAGLCSVTSHQTAFKQALQEFFQHHLSEKLSLLKFLSLIWSSKTHNSSSGENLEPAPGFSALLQLQSLHIGSLCLSSLSSDLATEVLQPSCTVVPSIIITLNSPISAIRKSAVSCLKSIGKLCSSVQPSPITALITVLLDSAEELSADPAHLQRLFACHFASLSTTTKSPQGRTSVKVKAKKKAEERTLEATLDYILQHAIGDDTPLYVQRRLLLALSSTVTQSVLSASLPKMEKLLTKCQTDLTTDESVCLQLLLKKYTSVTAPLLETEPQSWDVMIKAMKMQTPACPGHPSPLVTILHQITNPFFQAITSTSIQQSLLKKLLDILVMATDAELGNKVKAVIWQVSFKAEQIVEELCQGIVGPEKEAKRKKIKRASTFDGGLDEHTGSQWRRLRIFLELLQHKINISDPHRLVPTLFALLSRCIELDVSEQASLEYTKQLLLSQVLMICQKLSPDGTPVRQDILSEDLFDVELVVQCVRVSESPQTHHQALLLLAVAANLFPEKVLHNIMSIFTFMGASVMRQDDSYSFQVISRTVETVIPALIQAGERHHLPKRSGGSAPVIDLDSVVAMVVRVFVDASPHVPEHRQLPLFTHLISTVGAAEFLHTALILLLERHVVHSVESGVDSGTSYSQSSATKSLGLDFCLTLCHHFGAHVQV